MRERDEGRGARRERESKQKGCDVARVPRFVTGIVWFFFFVDAFVLSFLVSFSFPPLPSFLVPCRLCSFSFFLDLHLEHHHHPRLHQHQHHLRRYRFRLRFVAGRVIPTLAFLFFSFPLVPHFFRFFVHIRACSFSVGEKKFNIRK